MCACACCVFNPPRDPSGKAEMRTTPPGQCISCSLSPALLTPHQIVIYLWQCDLTWGNQKFKNTCDTTSSYFSFWIFLLIKTYLLELLLPHSRHTWFSTRPIFWGWIWTVLSLSISLSLYLYLYLCLYLSANLGKYIFFQRLKLPLRWVISRWGLWKTIESHSSIQLWQ